MKQITVKIKYSKLFEIVNFILITYTIFLFIISVIIHNKELALQSCLMFLVWILFDYYNNSVAIISDEGIKCKKYGFVPWNDIKKVELIDSNIYFYNKKDKKFTLISKKMEDIIQIERAYKYMISKI